MSNELYDPSAQSLIQTPEELERVLAEPNSDGINQVILSQDPNNYTYCVEAITNSVPLQLDFFDNKEAALTFAQHTVVFFEAITGKKPDMYIGQQQVHNFKSATKAHLKN